LTPLSHENQRNETWHLQTDHGRVIVKWYRWLSRDAVTEVVEAEDRARYAGLPVPDVLYRSLREPLVSYAYVDGVHRIPCVSADVDTCAALFVRQLDGLSSFRPRWTPTRPARLPHRAEEAVCRSDDARLAQAVTETWEQLGQLAAIEAVSASHTDWRADNILFAGDKVAAVLDWEDVVLLPAAEAVG
jgi:Ser/Thr protein kinase RdoA (MazF antagonist)